MSDSSPQKWFKLEESFFKEVDHQLLQKLQAQLANEERATAIQRLTGLTDTVVCRHIAEMNISVESIAALRLVPLVAVAWADDRIEDNERYKIIQCAEKAGLTPGEPAYELLQSWLSKRPPLDLLDTWIEYARNLSQSLDGEARKNFQRTMVHQVQSIAEANGGLFGLGSIIPAESKIVEIVRQTLA